MQTPVALVPNAPPGTILTHAAGLARIEASLAGKEPLPIKNHIIPTAIFDGFDGNARGSFSQRKGEGGGIEVEGEVMALDAKYMGGAVEAVMRRMSEAAALFDAILETRVARRAEPRAASGEAVASLARDLSDAGLPVCMDILWSPSPGCDVWLGVGEAGEGAEALREFIGAHPAWRAG